MGVTLPATTKDCCITISKALPDVIGELAPNNIREDIAVYSALKSNQNEGGLVPIETQNRRGKTLTVEVGYAPPSCATPATSAFDMCTGDPSLDSDDMNYLTVDVDQIQVISGKIGMAEFRSLCENYPERLARRLRDAALDIIRAMSDDLYTLMHPEVGSYPKSGDPSALATAKTLNLLTDTMDINKAAWALMRQQFKLMHTNTNPLVIGGHKLDLSSEILKMANNQGGVNYNPSAVISGMNVWTDYRIDAAIEGVAAPVDSYALAWLPGAYRLLEAYDYIGDWEITDHPDVTKTTMEMFGIKFDFQLKFDASCETYIWALSKKYDLFSIAESEYSSCYNFNHKLLFKIGCGAPACSTDTEL